MKMEGWHSECTDYVDSVSVDSKNLSDSPSTWIDDGDISVDSKILPNFSLKENNTNSPTPSRDSYESSFDECSTKIEKFEEPLLKTSLINAALAKKRLQAYSKQSRKSPTKEETTNIEEKRQKNSAKKTKKGLCPDQKAKAVIQEIEEIKRMEDLKKQNFEDFNKRQAVANAIKSIKVVNISQNSILSDLIQPFKKREMKQRNYRRADFEHRRSNSPDDIKNKGKPSRNLKSPKNWLEYKQLNFTKSYDRFRNSSKRGSILSLVEKMYNFDLPSPLLEPLKYGTENGVKEVPSKFLKVTRSRPPLMYSPNLEHVKDSFLSRDQLFGIISHERQQLIMNTINNHAKPVPFNKKMQSQSWFNKLWKKSSIPECKVLENSVGLSFLQNYSDEEEENETEEILICSSIKKTKNDTSASEVEKKQKCMAARQPEIIQLQSMLEEHCMDGELILTPELERGSIFNRNDEPEDEAGFLTPEIPPLHLQKIQRVDGNDWEQNLEGKSLHSYEECDDDKVKNAKKKMKRKIDSTRLDGEETPKKRRKKKKRTETEDSDSSSESERRRKKKSKRGKNRGMLPKKKQKTSSDGKKKSLNACEQDSSEKKSKKNKKRSSSSEVKLPRTDDAKKISKSKINKRKRESSGSDCEKKSNKKDLFDISNNFSFVETKNKVKTIAQLTEKEISHKRPIKQERADECRSKGDKIEQVMDVMIKKEPVDDFCDKIKSTDTPNTEEYRGNWEKEFDPVWESVQKRKQLNSSWESDDEPVEPARRPVESRKFEQSRNVNDVLDLEIPLNIKPFKKREIPDLTAKVHKVDNFNLEIESFANRNQKTVDDSVEMEKCRAMEYAVKELEKKRRWDKKEASSKNEESQIELNKSDSTILENEYEEFIKAVSSNPNCSPSTPNTNDSITDSIINSSKRPDVRDLTKKKDNVIVNRRQIIAPKDIPFIPMPEDVKIQPVPSPRIVNLPNIPLQSNDILIDCSNLSGQQLIVEPTSRLPVIEEKITDSPGKTVPFTLILPSKKTLLVNSNLKLGDSDDESEKVIKPIKEVRKERPINEKEDGIVGTDQKKNSLGDIHSVVKTTKSPVRSDHKHHENKSKSSVAQSSRYRRRETPPRRRGYSPKRDSSPQRRRRKSPERYRDRGRSSPTSRRYSSRRSHSPGYRRRTPSPRRRSSTRSVSPRNRPLKKARIPEKMPDSSRQISSPSDRPKRSVADSTISDDSLLLQPTREDYAQSPLPHYFEQPSKFNETKRMSLDDRINIELGFNKDDLKPISTTYNNFCHNEYDEGSQFTNLMENSMYGLKSNFVQMGNMVEIVPADLDLKRPIARPENKSQILQIGNVLEIVPTELSPDIPLPPFGDKYNDEVSLVGGGGGGGGASGAAHEPSTPTEKRSAETTMKQKIVERRAEREKRRQEREARRKEKENRRREKEKQRQIKMKKKTENMIKKALQLEVEAQDGGDSTFDDTPAQWPPLLPNVSTTSKDHINKSILLRGRRKSSKLKKKKVQFADGVRPGEGTSPSAGEELSSPPPCKVLPKEKRYTKTKLRAKNTKKKVKVKVIKATTDHDIEESEDEDNLPPPSPPPGSPPPHLFPPRMKIHHSAGGTLPYVPNVVINQSPALYRSPVNMLQMLTHQRSFQQLHLPGDQQQQQQPPLPDSPMQVHSFPQYQVPPPPPESALGPVHRNHHFNYPM